MGSNFAGGRERRSVQEIALGELLVDPALSELRLGGVRGVRTRPPGWGRSNCLSGLPTSAAGDLGQVHRDVNRGERVAEFLVGQP